MSNKFQSAWNKLFEELSILQEIQDNWFFDLSANQIKEVSGREPRLMTKIDFRQNLPKIMDDNDLSILAIKNGLYRIAKTDPFIDIPKLQNREEIISIPLWYISIDPFDITSESMAMDIAKISGMMDKVFWEESELTIRWRLRKWAQFDFLLQDTTYTIDGVQIEVDWWYEWATKLNLIEAKIWSSSNISIRQIIYPELAWKNIIGEQKQICSYIFLYENPFFRFIPVVFLDWKWKTDITNEKVFVFQEDEHFDIYSISITTKDLLDYNAPVPQANSFDKVLIILRIISNYSDWVSKNDLLEEMREFDLHTERQIDYYFNCLRLLKFINYEQQTISLNQKWRNILKLKVKEQAFEIAKLLFSNKALHKCLHDWVDSVDVNVFKENWATLNKTTLDRRKSTIKSWIQWFKDVFEV